MNPDDARIALSHDWLLSIGGGERCLAVFADLFPRAKIYTAIHRPEKTGQLIPPERVQASFLDRYPEVLRKYHRQLLPLMPRAFESLQVEDVDLILSSSHCAAKGIRKPEGAKHICFCYTPMRYVWDLYETYLESMSGVARQAFSFFAPRLRKWDKRTASNVDQFIAISKFIAERIERVYERDSIVIYPPVDCNRFTIDDTVDRGEHYLVLSRLVSYKRIDIVVEAFASLPYKLRIVGDGPQLDELKEKATSNVEFSGFVAEEKLVDEYRSARALIVTAIEDFGLAPIEAAACGTPTIALAIGGYLETVQDGVSGIFYNEQSAGSLKDAVKSFTTQEFNPDDTRKTAIPFDIPQFKRQIRDLVSDVLG